MYTFIMTFVAIFKVLFLILHVHNKETRGSELLITLRGLVTEQWYIDFNRYLCCLITYIFQNICICVLQ